ncbi:hypothetical protein T005_000899 [Salmonella enterica subsp. enterica]|nr:hypothetical protein [Salmonella enterica subsp. enterica]
MIVVTDQYLVLIAKWLGTKTGHTKSCIALQGFVCFWCKVCACDKKLAQEDKNHLALMLCLRSLM